MPKIAFILMFTFCLTAQKSFAQQEFVSLKESLQTYDYNKVSRNVMKMARPNTKADLYAQSTELYKRKLVGNYEQLFYRIDIYESGYYKKAFYLNLIHLSKKLIHASLQEVDGAENQQWQAPQDFQELVKAHQKLHKCNPDAGHPYFIPKTPVTIGFRCGYAGMSEPETALIVEMVRNKNLEEIKKWCTSLIPEVRCYGIIGLTLLMQNGHKLSKDEKALVRVASGDKTLVDMCKGSAIVGFEAEFREMYSLGVKELSRLVK